LKLVTYASDGAEHLGALISGENVLDLNHAAALRGLGGVPSSMIELLGDWERGLPLVAGLAAGPPGGAVRELGEVALLAPVPRPPRIRDYMTYEQHIAGAGVAVPPAFAQAPACYKGNPFTVTGPETEICWPGYTDQLDYELEIGFYVAGHGSDLGVEEAGAHVAGVTLFNDVSARDIQMLEMTMMIGPSKGKDFCNVMGPCLVTIDEVDEFGIEMVARVNGEEWSRGTSASRRFSFAQLLAWASWAEPLVPGEFLAVGTVGGGCGMELGRWIQPGDVVELEATGIGVLRNRIGARQKRVDGNGLDFYAGAPRFEPRPAGAADVPGAAGSE
jgi:2-keto-4-pentenoate hydratase/2-oxohepta-3-ene-1,7-dioic acid hydratase in catechol pathway